MGIFGSWAHLCHNQVSSTCPQFAFTCVNPHLSPNTPLNGHLIKVYAIILKPIFFWDTLYLDWNHLKTFTNTAGTICSNFVSIHIWFVSNIGLEQILCITLDLIFRKQQVSQKIAFYFPTETCCLLRAKSNVRDLKKVFESRKTCSNSAQHFW